MTWSITSFSSHVVYFCTVSSESMIFKVQTNMTAFAV